jgi:DNA-binding transcriptional ArsR family regulator
VLEKYCLTSFDQLKIMTDPIRSKILWEIQGEAKTGTMIAELINLSAQKVHYHLSELEKANIVVIEKTELKNGIVQKFYRPIAKEVSFEKLLPLYGEMESELSESVRENMMGSLDKTKSILKKVEPEAIQELKNLKQFFITAKLTSDQYLNIKRKYNEIWELLKEYNEVNSVSSEAVFHHFNLMAFPIEKITEKGENK